ncbi:hypothetical protein HMPREF9056_00010 [Actinomyces sp. oral taxon 170 str. F0386]|nr:hypothetical protein HMPREF9056_00010 [Actinomyces sp. oral taxon 170 str. F0386]
MRQRSQWRPVTLSLEVWEVDERGGAVVGRSPLPQGVVSA